MTAETLELIVEAERRETGIAWQPFEWHAVALTLAGTTTQGAARSPSRARFRSSLTLYRTEAENYLFNLSGGSAPAVYVVMTKPVEDAARPELLVLTCDPYEAQSFTLANDRIVDALAMPSEIEDWVRRFVAVHYKEEAFAKRKRGDKAPKSRKEDGHGAG